MTIGTGKLARDQQRAAASSRGRRAGVRLASGSSGLPAVAGSSTCAICSATVPRRELMFRDEGAACGECFGDAEDAAFEAAVPGLGGRLVAALPVVLPLWAYAGLLGWFSATLDLSNVPPTDELLIFMVIASLPVVLVLVPAIERVRGLGSGLRRLRVGETQPLLEASVEAAWLGIAVAGVVLMAALPLVVCSVLGAG